MLNPVPDSVGFAPFYFSKAFKREMDITSKEYNSKYKYREYALTPSPYFDVKLYS